MHPPAVLIGDVVIEAGVCIGPFATLRADFGGIHTQKNAGFGSRVWVETHTRTKTHENQIWWVSKKKILIDIR